MDVEQVLARYGLTGARIEAAAQGSTNCNVTVESNGQRFFLRRYAQAGESSWNRILCNEETIRYEHQVLRYAAEQGVPCIPPLENASGDSLTVVAGRHYALFPYVQAEPYRPTRAAKGIREAALLARYHNAMQGYPLRQQRPGWGYWGRLGAWFHQNQVGIGTLEELLAWMGSLGARDQRDAYLRQNAAWLWALVRELEEAFPEELYACCPVVVNHGD